MNRNSQIKKGLNLTNAERVVLLKNLRTHKDIKSEKIRICFYGRVSTEHEAQLSALQAQMQWYDEQLKNHKNWVLVQKYIDEGITGTQAKKRPAFLKMLKDAEKGNFDLIVTREVCRFARNTVQSLETVQSLKHIGIEVYFVSDNIWSFDVDSEFRLAVMSSLAQEESRKTSERVKAGQQISRENGVLYGNGNILGYKRVGKTYAIVDEEAEIVRRIYSLYLEGYGMFRICRKLEEEKVVCPTNGKITWTASKISRILNNTTYKGVMSYGQSFVDDFLNQRRVKELNKEEYVQKEVKIPRIIEPAIWDKVAEIKNSRQLPMNSEEGNKQKKRCANVARDTYAKKLVCTCGSSMRRNVIGKLKSGETRIAYQCYRQLASSSAKRRAELGIDNENDCDIKMKLGWKIDLFIKMTIEQIWTDRQPAVIKAYEILLECYSDGVEDNSEEIDRFKGKIDKLTKKLNNYISIRADEEITREQFFEMKEPIEKSIEGLKASLVELEIANGLGKTGAIDIKAEVNKIRKVFNKAIDFSKPTLPDVIVDYFIRRIKVMSNSSFEVDVNLDGSVPEEGKLLKEDTVIRSPLFDFSIDYNTAKQYKNSVNGMLRVTQWEDDMEINVYIVAKM